MRRDLIDVNELERSDIDLLLRLTREMKQADRAHCVPPLLHERCLAMLFEEPSTRTRVSFEVAMTRLGGHALYLKPGEIHLGARESLADTARVLSRMCDVLMARTLQHETIEELRRWSTVPVINGLTSYNHPTQAICDAFTIMEHLPPGKALADSTIVFVGDATNVCSSTMHIASKLGMHFVHAGPAAYHPPEEWLRITKENLTEAGTGSVEVTEDVERAVTGADFVYTDLWWWVDQEDEIPDRRAAFMPRYQVNAALMALAPRHSRFMHCLPASRGVEVTDEVADSPQSIIFDQAENRLHAEMAILAWTTAGRLHAHEPTTAVRASHTSRIHELLGLGTDSR